MIEIFITSLQASPTMQRLAKASVSNHLQHKTTKNQTTNQQPNNQKQPRHRKNDFPSKQPHCSDKRTHATKRLEPNKPYSFKPAPSLSYRTICALNSSTMSRCLPNKLQAQYEIQSPVKPTQISGRITGCVFSADEQSKSAAPQVRHLLRGVTTDVTEPERFSGLLETDQPTL